MNFFKRLFLKRVEEADLNRESIKAAAFYVKQQGANRLPVKEHQDMLNHVAHGFYMGWRKLEEELGVKNEADPS